MENQMKQMRLMYQLLKQNPTSSKSYPPEQQYWPGNLVWANKLSEISKRNKLSAKIPPEEHKNTKKKKLLKNPVLVSLSKEVRVSPVVW